jgi:8-oxo-dGTP pyrophosphatase MutT (NUDIX family)
LSDGGIIPLKRIEARYEERPWRWAQDNRAAIEAHWQKLTASKPSLFNGRVLIASERCFERGVYRATYIPADYAAFLAWRDFGWPDKSVSNGFAMAALRSSDGAYVLGIMGAHTANPGAIYFPAGTPDLADVTPQGDVDLAGSVLRELEEETGLGVDAVTTTDDWTAIIDGGRTALMREMRSPMTAEEIEARVGEFLIKQENPELAGLHVARSVADIDAARMPPFTQVYLKAAFAADDRRRTTDDGR